MLTVYLCGGINALPDAMCMDWREEAKQRLDFDPPRFRVLDPMRRDYRGMEAENVAAIVDGDLNDVCSADVLLVNAQRPSWGTAMEIRQAFQWGKRIVAFGAGERPSPWLAYHAELFPTLHDAITELGSGGDSVPPPTTHGEHTP